MSYVRLKSIKININNALTKLERNSDSHLIMWDKNKS
jgi:hypothetical protein